MPPLENVPGRDRVAEGLAEPLERLPLDEVGRAGDDGEVDVVAGGQRVAEHGDLEARRRDEREVARTRLRDRVVEHDGRLVERLQHGRRPERDRRRQRRAQRLVDGWLLGPRLIEALPGPGDQLGRVCERFCARHVQPQRGFRFRHAEHRAIIRTVIPELTDAQREVQALVREFCQREIAPHTAAWDADHHVPLDALRALAELGVLGVTIPEEHGGAGLDHTTLCLVVEELARHDPGISVAVAVHAGLTAAPIKSHGTPEQQARMLPPLASGEQLGCYALTEPDAGSDTASIRLRAERDGDDWLLHGTKTWITNGGFADAVIVFARTGGAGRRRRQRVPGARRRRADGLEGDPQARPAHLVDRRARVRRAARRRRRPPRRRGRAASRSRSRRSTAAASRSPPRPAASRARPSTWPRATPRSARRSAGRSRASRACSSRSRTSPRSSRARAC